MSAFRRNRIIALAAPWMTAGNPFEAQPESLQRTVYLQSFRHIMGTRRFITAVFGQQRRDKPLVKPYKNDQWKCQHSIDFSLQSNAKVTQNFENMP